MRAGSVAMYSSLGLPGAQLAVHEAGMTVAFTTQKPDEGGEAATPAAK